MARRIHLFLAVLCLSLLAPCLATAQQQEQPVFTFVALWDVPRDKWAEFTAFNEKNSRPVLDRLTADGTIVGWGSIAAVVHEPDGFTHRNWFEATSITGIERALGELLKLPPNPATIGARHRDYLFRSLWRRTRATSPTTGYIWVSTTLVKPGRGDDWRALWDKYTKPTYEQLFANGTLTYLKLQVEQVHTDDSGMRWFVYIAPSIEAMDKAQAAIGAMFTQRPEEIGRAFAEVTVPAAHRDAFLRILTYTQK